MGDLLKCLVFVLLVNIHEITLAQEPLSSTTLEANGVTPSTPETSTTEASTPSSPTTGTTSSYYHSSSTPIPEEKRKKLENCSTPSTVGEYCTGSVGYQHNTSVSDLLSQVILPPIVFDLQKQCAPGNWCLDDSYYKNISDAKNQFYTSPLVTNYNLWNCLLLMGGLRERCNENELIFLVSSVGMLSDMDVIGGNHINTDCYARTVEAVHVLYSDLSRPIQVADDKDKCEYIKQITHTYICSGYSCNQAQRAFTEDFGPWRSIIDFANNGSTKCDFTLQCPPHYNVLNGPIPSSKSVTDQITPNPSNYSDLEKALDDKKALEEEKLNQKVEEIESVVAAETVVNEIEHEMFGGQGTTVSSTNVPSEHTGIEQGMDIPLNGTDEDQTFVYGVVTVTIAVIVALTLIGVLTFRSINKKRKSYKLGYSQVSEEESRMLKSDYN